MRPDLAKEVRLSLCEPRELARALQLEGGAVRQGRGGIIVRCPAHEERHASCSIFIAKDGTIAARCHSCGFSGDALSLIAAAYGLQAKRDFGEILRIAAELGGRWDVVDELLGKDVRRPRPELPARPPSQPDREYPPIEEVRALLSVPAWQDADVRAWLHSRAIDPERLEVASVGVTYEGLEVGAVAYAIPPAAMLPSWARRQGRPWIETGHQLLVPMVDATGQLRSVRAVRITDGETPKRLPPAGHRASGLVMADELALGLLRGTWRPGPDVLTAVRIVEGEPDFLSTLSARTKIPTARIGIVSGSWTRELSARVPAHAVVAINTHNDSAGDRYAAEIRSSLQAANVIAIARTM